MGLSWQQGPLAPGAIGRFLVPDPLPERLLFAEPLRRRMRVKFGGAWIADSEDVVLLHEPGRYPVAYFPLGDIFPDVLQASGYRTEHSDLGPTSWYTVRAGAHSRPRAAWQHTGLPDYASELKERVAFGWRAMDAFYEEDERTDLSVLTPVEGQTFCPYKGLASCFDVGSAHMAAWSYQDAWTEAGRISGHISFEPDKVAVTLDGQQLQPEPGQAVIPHGIDRDLTTDEVAASKPS